jgi:hypothetical protein
MLKLEVENFLGIAHAVLEDEAPFSVVVGPNNSGKSSLASAVEYAFTGSACGLRGHGVSDLVRRNGKEARMRVAIEVGNWKLARTKASGMSQGEIASGLGIVPDALPLLFGHRHCLEGDRMMRALLDAVGNDTCGLSPFMRSDELRQRLSTVQAKNPGATISKLIEAGEKMRASYKIPGDPVVPGCAEPAADAFCLHEQGRDRALTERNAISEELNAVNADLAVLSRCKAYLVRLEEYRVSLRQAGDDPLGSRRVPLRRLSGRSINDLCDWDCLLSDAGFEAESKQWREMVPKLEAAIASATATLTLNPAPKAAGSEPLRTAEVEERLNAFADRSLSGVEAEISSKSALREALVRELSSASDALTRTQADIETLASERAQWTAYRAAMATLAEQKYKAQAEWESWDSLVKILRGYQEQRRRAVQEKILGRVEEFGLRVMGGRRVALDSEGEITLDARPLDTASGSERWRVSICVMAAIALYLGSPILVLDGADILDDQNKVALVRFLARDIVPFFNHTLLLTTSRGDGRDERPVSFASKWLIRGGALFEITRKLGGAAGALVGA